MAKKVLEIGCGVKKYLPKEGEEVIYLDKLPLPGVDIVHDLNVLPYPFKDDTFDKIVARHVLEHLDDVVAVMKELWRICKDGAEIYIEVPHFSSASAFVDPTHRHFFSFYSFDYFDESTQKGSQYKYFAGFTIISKEITCSFLTKLVLPIIKWKPGFYERRLSGIFPADYIKVTLRVKKKKLK